MKHSRRTTDKEHQTLLIIAALISITFILGLSQCGVGAVLAEGLTQKPTAGLNSFIPDKETMHVLIELMTLWVIFWKIALPVGKFLQWKEDHEVSNKKDFKNLHRRVDDFRSDLQEMRAKI